jgi:hypothetical protein
VPEMIPAQATSTALMSGANPSTAETSASTIELKPASSNNGSCSYVTRYWNEPGSMMSTSILGIMKPPSMATIVAAAQYRCYERSLPAGDRHARCDTRKHQRRRPASLVTVARKSLGGLRMRDHQVQFYENDAYLISQVMGFMAPAWRAGDSSIIIATQAHIEAIHSASGRQTDPALEDGLDRCLLLDARKTLSSFMVDGRPDESRFQVVVGGLLDQISGASTTPISVFGEMVALLYEDGQPGAAIQLELYWARLIAHYGLSLLCAYPMQVFSDETHRRRFQCICDVHSAVEFSESRDTSSASRRAPRRQEGGAVEPEADTVFDVSLVTVEAAATQLRLSRPHVVKLIAEGQFSRVVHRDGRLPLISAVEVSRLGVELEARAVGTPTEFHTGLDKDAS